MKGIPFAVGNNCSGRWAGEKSTRKGVIFTVWVESASRMRIRLSLLDKNGQAIGQESLLLQTLKSILYVKWRYSQE